MMAKEELKGEIMSVVVAAHDDMVRKSWTDKLVLKGLRTHGLLGYRPDIEGRKLVKVEQDKGSWAEDMQEGSHTYPQRYLTQRYDWADPAGIPVPVDWTNFQLELKRAIMSVVLR